MRRTTFDLSGPAPSLIINSPSNTQELQESSSLHSKARGRHFPGGAVLKNLPCNAEDKSLIPGRGTKIPHAVGQLIDPTTTVKVISALLNSFYYNGKES